MPSRTTGYKRFAEDSSSAWGKQRQITGQTGANHNKLPLKVRAAMIRMRQRMRHNG